MTPTNQRNAVSEGMALGLAMLDRTEIPADRWKVSMAFENAWDSWPNRGAFPQVNTDLRKGTNGAVVMTRATEQKRVWALFWEQEGAMYKIYARETYADEDFDPESIAEVIGAGLAAGEWKQLAGRFIRELDRT